MFLILEWGSDRYKNLGIILSRLIKVYKTEYVDHLCVDVLRHVLILLAIHMEIITKLDEDD